MSEWKEDAAARRDFRHTHNGPTIQKRKPAKRKAIAGIGYLERSFGGYPLDEPTRRPYVRMFRHFTASEIQAAIDAIVLQGRPRPAPNEIADVIRMQRRQVATTINPEPWPDVAPETVSERIAVIRQQLVQKGVRA